MIGALLCTRGVRSWRAPCERFCLVEADAEWKEYTAKLPYLSWSESARLERFQAEIVTMKRKQRRAHSKLHSPGPLALQIVALSKRGNKLGTHAKHAQLVRSSHHSAHSYGIGFPRMKGRRLGWFQKRLLNLEELQLWWSWHPIIKQSTDQQLASRRKEVFSSFGRPETTSSFLQALSCEKSCMFHHNSLSSVSFPSPYSIHSPYLPAPFHSCAHLNPAPNFAPLETSVSVMFKEILNAGLQTSEGVSTQQLTSHTPVNLLPSSY